LKVENEIAAFSSYRNKNSDCIPRWAMSVLLPMSYN